MSHVSERERKEALRASLSRQRRSCTRGESLKAGEVIAERLTELLADSRLVATFMPFDGEPEFALALHQRLPKHEFVYPICRPAERELTFHFSHSPPSRVARWGLREPEPEAPVAAAGEIDAIICPGLAFDRQGGRLGMGAGYYDRFLCRTRPDALLIGIGYSWQLVDHVPMEAHDIRVHYFVSTSMTLRTPAGRNATKLLENP